MSLRTVVSSLAVFVVVVAVLALVVGQLLGYPLLFGFVTTDSMEPSLSPGDGFVAVPSALAGEPQVGDVVVFEAEEIQGGGLTTHRIVDETDEGYVTAGDANPFTDQDAGERHLTESDILVSVLQFQGEVVAIPHLGTAAMAVQGLVAAPFALLGVDNAGTILVVAGIALFVIAGALGEGRQTTRSTSRENVIAVWSIILTIALVLAVAATVAMVAPSGTYDIEVITTDDPSEDTQVVAPGETATANYTVHNGGIIPTLVVSDPGDPGTTVDPPAATLGWDQQTDVTVSMATPEAEGEYVYTVTESRYLVVLPPGLLAALHGIHPLVALLAVNVTIAVFVVAGCIAVFGTGYLRVRPGSSIPLGIRIKRKLRRFW